MNDVFTPGDIVCIKTHPKVNYYVVKMNDKLCRLITVDTLHRALERAKTEIEKQEVFNNLISDCGVDVYENQIFIKVKSLGMFFTADLENTPRA